MLDAFIKFYWFEYGTFAGIENTRLGQQIQDVVGNSDKKNIRKYCAERLGYLESKNLTTEMPTKLNLEYTNQTLLCANTVLMSDLRFAVDDELVSLYDMLIACTNKSARAESSNKVLQNMNLSTFDKYVAAVLSFYVLSPNSKVNCVVKDLSRAKTKIVNCTVSQDATAKIKDNTIKLISTLARVLKKYDGIISKMCEALLLGKATQVVERAFNLGITVNQLLSVVDACIPSFIANIDEPNSFDCSDGFVITVNPDGGVLREDVCVAIMHKCGKLKGVNAF